jgi:peptidoglycan/xylan/chitin deacetylase (PgdA/CDA1 family)
MEQWPKGRHAGELRCLGWDELAALADVGWEIGSHTVTHPRLTQLDDERLGAEMSESKRTIEARLGRPCGAIAYPYGDVDARVMTAAYEAGYTTAAALPTRYHAPLPLRWPRVGVYHDDSLARFRRQVSRGMRWLQVSPVWPAAQTAVQATRSRTARTRS